MKKYSLFFFFLGIVFIYYHQSFSSYFEGDEWFYFSEYFPLLETPFQGFFKSITKGITDAYWMSGGGHVTPLQSFLWYAFIYLFRLNFIFFIFIGVVLHSLNSYLVYRLARIFFKNWQVPLLISLYFATNAAHFQAVNWAMVVINDLLLTSFVLLSLLLVSSNHYKKKTYVAISAFFFLGALLIKESAALLFVVYPLFTYLFNRKKLKSSVVVTVLLSIFYIPFRFLIPTIYSEGKLFTNNLPLNLSYPKELIDVFSNMLMQNLSIFQTNDFLRLAIFIASFTLFVYSFFYKRNNESKAIIIGFSIIFLNASLVLLASSFAPRKLSFETIDSRYLYFVSIGLPFVIAGILSLVYARQREFKSQLKVLFVITFGILLILNYYHLQNNLNFYKETGKLRKNFLKDLLSEKSELTKHDIFLIESNKGYYGFPSIPPFQTNLGQILAVHYYNRNELDPSFLNDRKVQKLPPHSSWFLRKGDSSFGYYVRREDLYRDGLINSISHDSIYAFEWDGDNSRLINVSEKFRRSYLEEVTSQKVLDDWKRVDLEDFYFKADKKYSVIHSDSNAAMLTNSSSISVKKVIKSKDIFFHDFVLDLTDSDGARIGSNWKTLNINNLKTGTITVVYVLSGKYPMYLVPAYDGASFIELSAYGEDFLRDPNATNYDGRNFELETIIKSVILIR